MKAAFTQIVFYVFSFHVAKGDQSGLRGSLNKTSSATKGSQLGDQSPPNVSNASEQDGHEKYDLSSSPNLTNSKVVSLAFPAQCSQPAYTCTSIQYEIDSNYNDCNYQGACDRSWERGWCQCALACESNPRCTIWTWETDAGWCWQKPRQQYYQKHHGLRVSGSKRSCCHVSGNCS